jgi:RND superfamily putative drug exporter
MPLLIGVVLLLSFVLLMAVFRSILVPLKAVVMNLLSIGAAYGIIVAIFQWGWAMNLIGVDKAGPIEAWVPMFLFAIVFGLSMDYEVFLLSRIKEEYDRTKQNATAVADGLAATARVITAAAPSCSACSRPSRSVTTASSSCSGWAWRSPCSSTPPWCA